MMNVIIRYAVLVGVILLIIALGLAELPGLLARQWQK